MSEKGTIKRMGTTGFVIIGTVLIILLLTAIDGGWVPVVQGASGQASTAAASWQLCTIQNVATYPGRIHVRCSGLPDTGIYFLAASTKDAAHAARLLSIMSTAKVAGLNLSVLYDADDTDNLPSGCLVGDCRELLAVEMW